MKHHSQGSIIIALLMVLIVLSHPAAFSTLVIVGMVAMLLVPLALVLYMLVPIFTVGLCIAAGVVLGLNVGVFAWAVWWLLGGLAIAFPVLMVAGRVMMQQAKGDVK